MSIERPGEPSAPLASPREGLVQRLEKLLAALDAGDDVKVGLMGYVINAPVADLLREAAQSLEAASRREQRWRKLMQRIAVDHAVNCGWWHAEGDENCDCGRGTNRELREEAAALLGDRETREET